MAERDGTDPTPGISTAGLYTRRDFEAPGHNLGGEPYSGLADEALERHRRAPKNYRRSDERIREDVCERLAAALHVDPSEVEVQVHDGVVILQGSVPERGMKHELEDIVASCFGVRDVENRLRVEMLHPAMSLREEMSA